MANPTTPLTAIYRMSRLSETMAALLPNIAPTISKPTVQYHFFNLTSLYRVNVRNSHIRECTHRIVPSVDDYQGICRVGHICVLTGL